MKVFCVIVVLFASHLLGNGGLDLCLAGKGNRLVVGVVGRRPVGAVRFKALAVDRGLGRLGSLRLTHVWIRVGRSGGARWAKWKKLEIYRKVSDG